MMTSTSPPLTSSRPALGTVRAGDIAGRFGRGLEAFGRWLQAKSGAAEVAPQTPPQTRPADVPTSGGDRFASLASMIPGVVYQRIVSPSGDIRYTYISEGARAMFGVSPDEVMRNPEVLFQTYSEEYKANFRQRLLAASRSLTKWDVEASIVGADGSIRYTHAIATPERLSDGSVLWTGLILDATRIKQAEEELKAANRSVEAANKAKSLFLANMSHEIRTPMNGVFGMTDLLMRTDLTERQQRLVNTINQSAKSLLTIINDVLDVSRIEAGKLVLDRDEFDLRRSIEETVDLLAEAATKKGLELTLFVEPDVPARFMGDVGRLRQICTNIISNAVKFTNVGEVAITVGCLGKSEDGIANVEFKIRDSGIGIPHGVQERLFQPFEQADTSISRRFGGTGLGLAITKHLVEMMNGKISLKSELGHGSEFCFCLPLEIGSETAVDGEVEPASLQGVRILVLDDRATNREIISSYLRENGADVTCVETPQAAFHALRQAHKVSQPFSIAIIDMLLPGSSGLAVASQIKSEPAISTVKLMMVTSLNWKGDTQSARDHGFQAFLTKPVHHRELISTAARVLAQREKPGQVAAASGPACKALHTFATRVLVAEDNPVNIEVAREYLGNLNCSITQANNGAEAVAAFCEPRFDVILMDCQMPELDGLAATQRIRETEAKLGMTRTPIIAVTANAYEEDRARCLAAGMDDFLTKPFTEAQLQERLEKWVTSARVAAQSASDQGESAARANERQPTAVAPAAQIKAPDASEGSRLDMDMLERLQKSHPALFSRLLETYVRVAPDLLKSLVTAAGEGNCEALKTTAHSLKSSTANVGGTRGAELCRDLESMLKADPRVTAAQWQPLVIAIETELTAVMQQLAALALTTPSAGAKSPPTQLRA